MVKIIISPSARTDLKDIVAYIKRDSVYYANLEKAKIIDAINKIPNQILAGRIVPELGNEHIREVIFRNYRIIYEIISDKQLNILSIHHHSRNFQNNNAFSAED